MENETLLGLGQTLAQVPQAIQAGRQAGRQQYDAQQARQERREQVQHQKKLREYDLIQRGSLDTVQDNTDAKQQLFEQQLQLQTQQSKKLGVDMFRKDSYLALDSYLEDNNVKHVNEFLSSAQENTFAPKSLKGMLRADSVDLNSKEDLKMFTNAGVSQEELDALDGKEDGQLDWELIKTRYLKVTQADGTVKLVDVMQFAALTGYGKHATDQKLSKLETLANLNKKTSSGNSPSLTAMNRDSELYATLVAKVEEGTATPEEKSRLQFIQQEQGGTEVAKLDISKVADVKIAPYLDLPSEEFRSSPEVRKLVGDLELSHPLATHDRKMLTDLSQLTSLLKGEKSATELTTKQTGIWDKFSGSIWKKASEHLDPGAVASYGAFMNQLRNNLFGSALTEHEISAFNEAYSNRSDKLGAVLNGLRAATTQLVGKYRAIEDQNHEAVIKYYSGGIGQNLKQARAQLDWKLDLLQKIAKGEISKEEAMSMKFDSSSEEKLNPPVDSPLATQKPNPPAVDSPPTTRKPNQTIEDFLKENK